MDMMDVVKKVRNASTVIIRDYSSYCKWRCNNGGAYSFSVRFKRRLDGKWIISYGTSSEFPYCYRYGEFKDCWDCEHFDIETEECRAKPEVISTREAIEEVRQVLNDEFVEIEIDGETVKYGEYGCEQCRKGLH